MSTTSIGVVIDALVSVLDAQDGPPLRGAVVGDDTLYIGWDGTPDNPDAGTASQELKGIGDRHRDEQLSISCYAEATRGETTVKPTRDAAIALINGVENTLNSDRTLGGVIPGPGWAWLATIDRLAQPQTDAGSRVGIQFTVSARARL